MIWMDEYSKIKPTAMFIMRILFSIGLITTIPFIVNNDVDGLWEMTLFFYSFMTVLNIFLLFYYHLEYNSIVECKHIFLIVFEGIFWIIFLPVDIVVVINKIICRRRGDRDFMIFEPRNDAINNSIPWV